MRRPCLDTPEQLWISDFPVARPGGNQGAHGKFPWSEAIAQRAIAMREAGDTWREVMFALADITGVRIGEHAIQEYLAYHYGE